MTTCINKIYFEFLNNFEAETFTLAVNALKIEFGMEDPAARETVVQWLDER